MPSCVDADAAVPLQTFESLDELLAHPWIKSWNNDGREGFFYCWDSDYRTPPGALLMGEWMESGKRVWWVLGYMDEIPDLPKWRGGHERFTETSG